MNIRFPGESYATYSSYDGIAINTRNFERYSDLLLLKQRLASKQPCYIVFVSKDWSTVLRCFEVISISFRCVCPYFMKGVYACHIQDCKVNAKLTMSKTTPVFCRSIPDLRLFMKQKPMRKYSIVTIDNDIIHRKILKCIKHDYIDDFYVVPAHVISGKYKFYFVQSDILINSCASRYSLMGVNSKRIHNFHKMEKNIVLYYRNVFLVINGEYISTISKIRLKDTTYNENNLLAVHKNWNVVLEVWELNHMINSIPQFLIPVNPKYVIKASETTPYLSIG